MTALIFVLKTIKTIVTSTVSEDGRATRVDTD